MFLSSMRNPLKTFCWRLAAALRLTPGNNVYKAVFESKDPPEKIIADFKAQCADFDAARRPYLLY